MTKHLFKRDKLSEIVLFFIIVGILVLFFSGMGFISNHQYGQYGWN